MQEAVKFHSGLLDTCVACLELCSGMTKLAETQASLGFFVALLRCPVDECTPFSLPEPGGVLAGVLAGWARPANYSPARQLMSCSSCPCSFGSDQFIPMYWISTHIKVGIQ